MTSKNDDDKFKPVKINFPMLDKITEGGLKKGEISIITGKAGPPKTDFIKFLPVENEKGNYFIKKNKCYYFIVIYLTL